MQALVNWFTGLIDVLKSIIDFVIGIIKDLVYMIQLTGRFLAQIPSYFSWLPGSLISLVVVLFAIVVIYKIIGREG